MAEGDEVGAEECLGAVGGGALLDGGGDDLAEGAFGGLAGGEAPLGDACGDECGAELGLGAAVVAVVGGAGLLAWRRRSSCWARATTTGVA